MLKLWRMRNTSSLPLLLGPLWPGMVAPDKGSSQEKWIRTSMTWCESLGNYITPGNLRARVTLSDNIAQWRTVSSFCAKIETVNWQFSCKPSHLWTQQLIVPPTYHHTTCSLAVNLTSAYPDYPIMNPQTKALWYMAWKSMLCWGNSIVALLSQTMKQITS